MRRILIFLICFLPLIICAQVPNSLLWEQIISQSRGGGGLIYHIDPFAQYAAFYPLSGNTNAAGLLADYSVNQRYGIPSNTVTITPISTDSLGRVTYAQYMSGYSGTKDYWSIPGTNVIANGSGIITAVTYICWFNLTSTNGATENPDAGLLIKGSATLTKEWNGLRFTNVTRSGPNLLWTSGSNAGVSGSFIGPVATNSWHYVAGCIVTNASPKSPIFYDGVVHASTSANAATAFLQTTLFCLGREVNNICYFHGYLYGTRIYTNCVFSMTDFTNDMAWSNPLTNTLAGYTYTSAVPCPTLWFKVANNTTNYPPYITAGGLTPSTQIQWTNPGGLVTNTMTPPYTFFNNGSGPYTLWVSDWNKVTGMSFSQDISRAFLTSINFPNMTSTGLSSIAFANCSTTNLNWNISILTNAVIVNLNYAFAGLSSQTSAFPAITNLVNVTSMVGTYSGCNVYATWPLTNCNLMFNVTNFADCFDGMSNITGSVGDWAWRTNIMAFGSYNSGLHYTNRPGCLTGNVSSLISLRLDNSGMSKGDVDQVLSDLDTSGATNGTLRLDKGGTWENRWNARPSAAGLVSMTNLINKTWTVNVQSNSSGFDFMNTTGGDYDIVASNYFYLAGPIIPTNITAFSVSCWHKQDPSHKHLFESIFSQCTPYNGVSTPSYFMCFVRAAQIGYADHTYNYPSGVNLTYSTTNWNMLTWVISNTTKLNIYSNGYITGTANVTILPIGVATNATMGALLNIGTVGRLALYGLNGVIDDLAIWTNALTATEVSNLYALGVSSPLLDPVSMTNSSPYNNGGLLALWRFDDATGTNAADSAGTNTAYLVGNQHWTNGIVPAP